MSEDFWLMSEVEDIRVSEIDRQEARCGNQTTFKDWLAMLVGSHTDHIDWYGGRFFCKLGDRDDVPENHVIFCKGATFKTTPSDDHSSITETVEIYFTVSPPGHAGKPLGFRARRTEVTPVRTIHLDAHTLREFEIAFKKRYNPASAAMTEKSCL